MWIDYRCVCRFWSIAVAPSQPNMISAWLRTQFVNIGADNKRYLNTDILCLRKSQDLHENNRPS